MARDKETIKELRTALKIFISGKNRPFGQSRQHAEILLKYLAFEGGSL